MLLHTVASQFLTRLSTERSVTTHSKRLSLRTVANYRAHLLRWIASLPTSATLADVTPARLQVFLDHFGQGRDRGHPRAPSSVYQMAASLRAFARFVVAAGWWLDDPTRALRLPDPGNARRDMVLDWEVTEMWSACARLPGTNDGLRARALLCVLAYGGLRRQEVLDLELGDIDFAAKRIDVRHGKGDKARSVFLTKERMDALRDYLRVRPQAPHAFVFCANERFRLGAHGLAAIVRAVAKIAGIADLSRMHPHALRRGCATRLLRNGADLASIKAWLGHAHLRTTELYLLTDEAQLRECAALAEIKLPEHKLSQAKQESNGRRRIPARRT